jgi:hypothetical protein
VRKGVDQSLKFYIWSILLFFKDIFVMWLSLITGNLVILLLLKPIV